MSDLDQYKRDRQKMIEVRKMKAAVPDGELVREDDSAVRIVPKTFREKWDNYWYHYKLATIGAAFVAIVAFWLIWDVTHPTVYDGTISIVTQLPFDGLRESLEDTFQVYMEDYSGDGEKNLEVATYTVSNEGGTASGVNPQHQMAQQMRLMARLSIGEDFIFLLDEAGYEMVHEGMGMEFLDLAQYSESAKIEGDKYFLNDTQLLAEMGLEGWEGPLYLCFVDYTVYGEKKQQDKKIQNIHANSKDLFFKLIDVG